MATKKPAVSTQLKNAIVRISELEKQLESSKNSHLYAQKREAQATEELGQVHAFLDALPGALPKRDEARYTDNLALTRLAAWFATR